MSSKTDAEISSFSPKSEQICHQKNYTKEILKEVIQGEEHDSRWNHRNTEKKK